ncbi:MAG: hypothetical protein NDP13_00275 [Crenarchaeota archaeon]|nr:hypothetical protein [Thermoproteota archaeon]MCR8454932.1 hypothetical protein [Thermoproteota archaeon]MCR8500723.1 hypothetical protein [Thermoproteota archaeon]
MSSPDKKAFGMAPLTALFSLKVLLGVALGLFLGLIGYLPNSPVESLVVLISLFGIPVYLALFFKLKYNVRESLIKLILLYGTLGYFACVLSFWALVLNL